MRNGSHIAALLPALAIAACTGGPPPQPAAGAAQPVSFDGLYRGTVAFRGATGRTTPHDCETDPNIALQVSGNAFTYVQAHPNVANTAPGLTAEATTATYTARIGPDGSIQGRGQPDGTIQGTVSGTHMSGRIDGVLCSYTFTADRM